VKRLAFAVPGDLATPTGGYAYDRRMISELGRLGWQIDVIGLGEGFPLPTDTTRAAAQASLFDIPKGRTVAIDGLALGALPEAFRERRMVLPQPDNLPRSGICLRPRCSR